jgi:hypothetical protein
VAGQVLRNASGLRTLRAVQSDFQPCILLHSVSQSSSMHVYNNVSVVLVAKSRFATPFLNSAKTRVEVATGQ